MAKVIIGIHGLGNKPAKDVLEKWWLLSMKEGLKAIGRRQEIPKFEMVYWADLFYDLPLDERIGDKDDPRYLDEPYRIAPKLVKASTSPTRLKVLDFLGEKVNKFFLNQDFSLKYSFITDAIAEKFFHEFKTYFNPNEGHKGKETNEVRQLIAQRLIDILDKYLGDDILIVSHSMGSIIAFDILTFITPHAKIQTLVTIGSPLGMPNVLSEIAELERINGEAKVKMHTPPAVEKNWYNFSDPEDKVAFFHKLSTEFSENSNGVKPIDFTILNNYLINGERNPHKSFGYLRAPEFANVLAEFIESKQTIKLMVINALKRVWYRTKKLAKALRPK